MPNKAVDLRLTLSGVFLQFLKMQCLTHQTWWKICASPTKLGGKFVLHPPNLVENLCLAHQTWCKICASPTKLGGKCSPGLRAKRRFWEFARKCRPPITDSASSHRRIACTQKPRSNLHSVQMIRVFNSGSFSAIYFSSLTFSVRRVFVPSKV